MFNNTSSRGRYLWPNRTHYGRRSSKSHEASHPDPYNHRSKLSYRQHRRQSMDQSLTQYPHHTFWGNNIVQPHFFDNLVFERSYLLESLQKEDKNATDLLKRIASHQDTLKTSPDTQSHRKIKKTVRWLKDRLRQINTQEKSILNRLGQVSFEIQNCERHAQVENERFHFPGATVSVSLHDFQQMHIDCPPYPDFDFTPQNAGPFMNQLPGQLWNDTELHCSKPNEYFPPVPPAAPFGSAELSVLELQSDGGVSMQDTSLVCKTPLAATIDEAQSASAVEEEHFEQPVDKVKGKRFSEPALNTAWDGESGSRYLGYFHATDDDC